MLSIATLEDIAALKETFDVECKLATGKDGNGGLPKSLWETYSAFANSYGGDIFLGIKEKSGEFSLAGINHTCNVLDDFWNTINNPQKVSANILKQEHVKVIEIAGSQIIHIHVPRASRVFRPVFINGNPIKGTYKRQYSGDYCCQEEVVRRMLAEQVEDSRDNEILKGYGLEDIDIDSFNAYRQLHSSRDPDHPWNQVDSQSFLQNIGGWRKDRETGFGGLTRAGLLMFGRFPAIREAFPNYMLDYQERDEPKAEARWIDRLTLDGSWSGNLFDFYRRVIKKLSADLKVPFKLEGDQRQEDTPIHNALREALVNTLAHADYTERASILIVKRPDMFGFRNPGHMRVPQEIAIQGGESDCRNRLIHEMFRYVGLGEQAGSGLPKIFQGWKNQHWRSPILQEKEAPSDQTLLELHMLSLVPAEALEYLRSAFEAEFEKLDQNERLILATAYVEKTLDHARAMSIMDIHPHDLTKLFAGLIEKGLLKRNGTGRGTIYFLPETELEDQITEILADIDFSGGSEISSGGLDPSSGGLEASSGGLAELEAISASISSRKKSPKIEVESCIIALCSKKPLTLQELAKLLNRKAEVIRKEYLQSLLKEKRLSLLYPTKPSHPEQAYLLNREKSSE